MPPTPSTCASSRRSVLQTSPPNTLRLPPAAYPITKEERAVEPDHEPKVKQSGWKRSMSRLFKSKSSAALRESSATNTTLPTHTSSLTTGSNRSQGVTPPSLKSDVPPVPTMPLNIKKRTAQVQSAYIARSANNPHPTPPPSTTRTEFGSVHGGRPSALRNEGSSSSSAGSGIGRATSGRQQSQSNTHNNSVYSMLMSPPPSARSESFPLESHPSLPLDPFASSLNSSANNLPTTPVVVDHQPLGHQQHLNTLPARPKLPRHSPSLRDLANFFPGNRQKLAKTKSLANLHLGKELSPGPESTSTKTKESEGHQSVSPLEFDFSGPPSLPAATTSTAPAESPPLLPPKPPYFPPTAQFTRPSSSIIGQPLSGPGSPLTPPPTSPLPPTPPSSSSQSPPSRSQTHTPVSGPSHTIPLAGEGATTPLTRSGSGVVLLPRSRSTSMSLRAPPSSSSFFDLYEQLGIWPTPEKAERPKGKENEEPTSPLISKTGLTASISDLASSLVPAEAQPAPVESGQISASVSATFSASSWQAAIDAFPIIETDRTSSTEAHADMSMDFGLPYVNSEPRPLTVEPESLQNRNADALTPEDAVEGRREREAARPSGYRSQGQASGSKNDNENRASTGLGIAGLRPTGRRLGGSGSSSRNSSRERKPHGTQASCQTVGDGSYSSDANSDDDIPLSELHPQAQVNRKIAEERRIKRRAERAARAVHAAQPTSVDHRRTVPVPTGRNPGGHENWNGEGGVPAEALSRKLSAILQIRSAPAQHQSQFPPAPGPSGYASSSKSVRRPDPIDTRALRQQRSFTGPAHEQQQYPGSTSVQRSSTTRVSSKYERQPLSPGIAPPMPSAGLQPSPVMYTNHTLYSPTSPYLSHGPSSSSRGSMSASARHPQTPQVPPPSLGHSGSRHGDHRESHDMSRHSTVASRHSQSRHSVDQRARVSPSDVPPRPYAEHMATSTSRSSNDAPPKGRSWPISILVEGSTRRLDVEVSSETYVRELCAKANEILGRPSDDKAWVLCEAFGELGCGESTQAL